MAREFSFYPEVSCGKYLIIKKEFFGFEIVIRRKKLFSDFLKDFEP